MRESICTTVPVIERNSNRFLELCQMEEPVVITSINASWYNSCNCNLLEPRRACPANSESSHFLFLRWNGCLGLDLALGLDFGLALALDLGLDFDFGPTCNLDLGFPVCRRFCWLARSNSSSCSRQSANTPSLVPIKSMNRDASVTSFSQMD